LTGHSPQRAAVAPTEEEEDDDDTVAVSVQSHRGIILEEIRLTDCTVFYF
jgi:hypothetical protein